MNFKKKRDKTSILRSERDQEKKTALKKARILAYLRTAMKKESNGTVFCHANSKKVCRVD